MVENYTAITDEEMADLPDDDKLAFVVYEERLRAKTRALAGDADGTELEREYVNHILAFIQVTSLDIPVDSDPPVEGNNFWEWYHRFAQIIDYHTVKFRLAHARGVGSGITTTVYLSVDYRTEIGNLLKKIRKVVNATDLPAGKKDVIYDKIAALQSEIDRVKTRFDAFLSRWLDVTSAIGEGTDNLKPAVKLMERAMKIFGRAKVDHDTGKLPPPEETPRLPKPEVDKASAGDLDDEIPF